jgi:hypothetical protein
MQVKPAGYDDFDLKLEQLFEKADNFMINQQNYSQAVSLSYLHNLTFFLQKLIYMQILEMDPDNIDCLNAIAACIKYLTVSG